MKHHHQLLHLCNTTIRRYATKYSGRVIETSENNSILTVKVEPPNIIRDIRGYALPRKHLICRITRILQSSSPTSDPFLELSDYLETLTLTLTSSEASEILKSLRTPRKSLEFFRFCSSSIPGFRHDCFTYNRILTILSKSTNPEAYGVVKKIVDEMEKEGVKGSISTVNILIGIFGSGNKSEVGDLERCLKLVKKWGLMFTCYTYKCLLQAYLRLGDVGKAFEVYVEMRRHGYKLDIFAYNMLLDSLAKHEKVLQNSYILQENEDQSFSIISTHCLPLDFVSW